MLWDTAGQEEFDAITKAYYRGAQACVLAFSVTDRDSFEAVLSWKTKVELECGDIPTVLVQNKMDLAERGVLEADEAELLARALGCRLIRTSVKEDVNVAAVFRHLAAACLVEMRRQDDAADYYWGGDGPPPLTISAFNPSAAATHNGKTHASNGAGTIVLRPGKQRSHRKKSVLRNACRIL